MRFHRANREANAESNTKIIGLTLAPAFDEVLSYPRSQYQKLKNKFMADDDELTALLPGAYKNARLAFLERQGE